MHFVYNFTSKYSQEVKFTTGIFPNHVLNMGLYFSDIALLVLYRSRYGIYDKIADFKQYFLILPSLLTPIYKYAFPITGYDGGPGNLLIK